jgi:hypothetical protein
MSILHIDHTISVADKFTLDKDPVLRAARLALNPQHMQNKLDKFARRLYLGKSIQLRNITVLRHKPGRRCVIEYNTLLKDKLSDVVQPFALIGKLYATHNGADNYQLQQTLWRRDFGEHARDKIHVPQPLGHSVSMQAVFQKKVSAVPLTGLLATPQALPLMNRVADLAHKIHHSQAPTTKRYTIDDELHILDVCLARVATMYPHWKSRIANLLIRAKHLASLINHPVQGYVHRDFHSGQVLVQDDRVYLHDLDFYCKGDVGLDIGGFIGNLMVFNLRQWGDPYALRDLSAILQERFVRLCGRRTKISCHVYSILTVIRHIFLSTQYTTECSPLTRELLGLGETLVACKAKNPMFA